jgi:hypothetical protein
MTALMTNIPLMVAFLALWIGIPTWLVLRHPDQKPEPAAAMPAVRTLPAYRHEDAPYRRVA